MLKIKQGVSRNPAVRVRHYATNQFDRINFQSTEPHPGFRLSLAQPPLHTMMSSM